MSCRRLCGDRVCGPLVSASPGALKFLRAGPSVQLSEMYRAEVWPFSGLQQSGAGICPHHMAAAPAGFLPVDGALKACYCAACCLLSARGWCAGQGPAASRPDRWGGLHVLVWTLIPFPVVQSRRPEGLMASCLTPGFCAAKCAALVTFVNTVQ